MCKTIPNSCRRFRGQVEVRTRTSDSFTSYGSRSTSPASSRTTTMRISWTGRHLCGSHNAASRRQTRTIEPWRIRRRECRCSSAVHRVTNSPTLARCDIIRTRYAPLPTVDSRCGFFLNCCMQSLRTFSRACTPAFPAAPLALPMCRACPLHLPRVEREDRQRSGRPARRLHMHSGPFERESTACHRMVATSPPRWAVRESRSIEGRVSCGGHRSQLNGRKP